MSIKEDYPNTFEDFKKRFQTEDDCIDYLIRLRWPEGFICPHCSSMKAWKTKRDLFHCVDCGRQTSITAGTLFHNTRKPLRLWFHVIWFIISQKTRASAKNLKDVMGFGSYETAWTWLHKLRRVMIRPGREQLNGTVEVDESYIGGEEKGLKGRKIEKKVLIIVAVEVNVNKLGRIRMRCIPNASAENLERFITDYIESGSTIITDGWKGFSALKNMGYEHEVVNQTKSDETSNCLPHVHLVISLIKRWLMGTNQGAVSSKHLSYYLDEYAFRFNRRLSTHRGKLFFRLMQQAVSIEATPLNEIIAGKDGVR